MGRVDGMVLIKFPSPCYFPRALKPRHELILFLLLLILLLSDILLRENPDSVETKLIVGLISTSLPGLSHHCPIWANITRAIQLFLSNLLCSIILL